MLFIKWYGLLIMIIIIMIMIMIMIIIIIIIIIIYCERRLFSILTHPPIAAHIEISIVGFGPATRGTWTWLYSTTTAHIEISIVGFCPAIRGTESWPWLYCTTGA